MQDPLLDDAARAHGGAYGHTGITCGNGREDSAFNKCGDWPCHGHGHGHVHDGGHGGVHGGAHSGAHGSARAPLAWTSSNGAAGTLQQSIKWLNAHDPVDCSCQHHEVLDCEIASCDHSRLNASGNVLVLMRGTELMSMARMNTFLAVVSIFYMALNLVGALLNVYNGCDLGTAGCSPATTPQIFHNLEFGATFIFNTVDVFALSYSPKTLSNQYENPTLLKLLVLFNVCISGVCFLLVAINLERFEILSHELEYSNELTVIAFDVVIFINLLRGRSHKSRWFYERTGVAWITALAAGSVAVAQLGIYNLSGWAADGCSRGEQNAHYLEFTFNCVSAGITFWFTMDNKICAERRLREIMYGNITTALQ